MPRQCALKAIHINRHLMAKNLKNGNNDLPVITVRKKHGRVQFHSNRVNILDDQGKVVATVTCDISRPLSCGARCYIETRNQVVMAATV